MLQFPGARALFGHLFSSLLYGLDVIFSPSIDLSYAVVRLEQGMTLAAVIGMKKAQG